MLQDLPPPSLGFGFGGIEAAELLGDLDKREQAFREIVPRPIELVALARLLPGESHVSGREHDPRTELEALETGARR